MLTLIKKSNRLSQLNHWGLYQELTKPEIDLLFEYLTKKPQELSRVFSILTKTFGFERDSYITKFIIQSTIIDKLLEK